MPSPKRGAPVDERAAPGGPLRGRGEFRRRHAFVLTHAHYRVLDEYRLGDVIFGVPIFSPLESQDPSDDWVEFAITRKPPGPQPAKDTLQDPADLIANFMFDEKTQTLDLYARSKELMAEARAILELLAPDSLEFQWEKPYAADSPRDKLIAERQRRL